MKPLNLYALVISMTLVAAAVQPAQEPVEVHAAMALAATDQPTACQSASCSVGWQAASDHAIYDVSDCRQLSDVQGEVEGCKVFVNEALQARLQNQW